MKIKLLLVLATMALMIVVAAIAADNKGAETLSIHGGSRGDVPFPHHAHQNRIEDCNTCHTAFPQEAEAIEKLKASKQLEPKQVMNKQCIKCHKDLKKDGNPTGPTTCSKCHQK